jgi:CubicO group peptidase (beta-lactamase class C family)
VIIAAAPLSAVTYMMSLLIETMEIMMKRKFEMKLFMRIGLAMVLTIAVEGAFSRQAAAQTRCSYDFSEVTALAQGIVDSAPLDGASLILIKDGQVIYERYFGTYDADTKAPIASASKWLSGATLMTLVDERKLDLDDQVSKYLPDYFTGEKGAITIRQLFSHTSGLPPIMDDALCLFNPRASMDACVQVIAQMPLIGPPGAQFAYGENSMQVAGRICEIVSGQSWESLFQEKIAAPLEMSGASFCAGAGCSNPMVGGGAQVRLRDYANFLRMIIDRGRFNGSRVLSVKSVREMQRNLTAGMPVFFAPRGLTAVNYGIGEWIDILDERGRAVQVSSPGLLGFTPWVDKDRDLIGIFMVQSQTAVYPVVGAIQQKVREIVDDCECKKKVE